MQTTLILALTALAIGPVLYWLAQRRQWTLAAQDGFIFVAISGLVLMEIVPGILSKTGAIALLALAAGLFGPNLLERVFQHAARQTHIATLILGVMGLIIHASLDGAMLQGGGHHDHGHMDIAIILHRLPVGLTIWWLMRPAFGPWVASGVLLLLMAATAAGFYGLQPMLDAHLSLLWLEALVAGSLLHVVLFRPHMDQHPHPTQLSNTTLLAERIGNLAGLAMLAAMLIGGPEIHTNPSMVLLYELTAEAAPALVLAYGLAGLLSVYMPNHYSHWLRRGTPIQQTLKGVAVGLPMPICTCGVLPLYQTLIRQGAPATAAMGFLIATPELGIDAILLSLPLLGLEMTGVRLVAAAILALGVGWLVGRRIKIPARPPQSCNHHSHDHEPKSKLIKALKDGYIDLVDHTAPWIVIGLIVAVICAPWLEQIPWHTLPPGTDVLLFALLGMPMYVCASGATPIVAALLMVGVSPGAALAFLLTGPATNISTFGLLSQLHGKKAAIMFATTTASFAIMLGLVTNLLTGYMDFTPAALSADHQHSWLSELALWLLALIFIASLWRQGARGFVAQLIPTDSHQHHQH